MYHLYISLITPTLKVSQTYIIRTLQHENNSTFQNPKILKLSSVKLLQDAENQHIRLCIPSS